MLQEIQAKAAAERVEAATAYHKALRERNADTAWEAAKARGHTPEQLEKHLRVLEQDESLAAVELQQGTAEELTIEREAVATQLDRHRAETERIKGERQVAENELATRLDLSHRRDERRRDAKGKRILLRRQHAALFGEPEPTPEPPAGPAMIGQFDLGRLDAVRERSLGAANRPGFINPRVIDGSLTYGGPSDAPPPKPAAVADAAPPPLVTDEEGPDDDEPLWDAQIAATGPRMKAVKS
jgi:hypothetical protein